ncbi:MAG: hypothetical protein ACLP59_09650 [Bryobacteraceae bacterium]
MYIFPKPGQNFDIARQARPAGSQAPRAANPYTTINSSRSGRPGNCSTIADWTPNTSFPNNGGGNTYDVTIGTGSDNVSLDTNVTTSLTLGNGSGSSILQNLSGSAESLDELGALTINGGDRLKFNNANTLTVRGGVTGAGVFSPAEFLSCTAARKRAPLCS